MQQHGKQTVSAEQEQVNAVNESVTSASATDSESQAENKGDASAAVPSAETILAEKLAQTEAKLSEMQDSFLRAKADGENIRRRAQEDISKEHKFAIESFAEALVPVKDSVEMALKIETASVEALKEGIQVTLRQITAAFERNRLLEISPAVGDKLDPSRHQAVSMVPAEQDANTVVEVLQKGYMIADRLLRPALVTVAQAK